MEYNTILYVSAEKSSDPVLAVLKETGCEVVNTDSPTEGVALLYIMHSVTAVVLDNRAREQAGFDVAQSLRQIRPDVPVILLFGDQNDSLRSCTDRCRRISRMSTG